MSSPKGFAGHVPLGTPKQGSRRRPEHETRVTASDGAAQRSNGGEDHPGEGTECNGLGGRVLGPPSTKSPGTRRRWSHEG